MAGKLTIKFDAFGNINCQAAGFTGTACQERTNEILGNIAQIKAEEKTDEYYDTSVNQSEDAKVQHRW